MEIDPEITQSKRPICALFMSMNIRVIAIQEAAAKLDTLSKVLSDEKLSDAALIKRYLALRKELTESVNKIEQQVVKIREYMGLVEKGV